MDMGTMIRIYCKFCKTLVTVFEDLDGFKGKTIYTCEQCFHKIGESF